MRGFLAVLRREVAERWLLALAALLLGLVPLLAPLLPLGTHLQGPDLRAGTALALALIASHLLALVLGSTVLARDLAERRLAFYFSRPLPGWSIWAGKLGGAALLSLGAGILVLLPSLLLGDRPDPGGILDPGLSWGLGLNVAIWTVTVLVLLLLANALGVMVRSRSPWLLLDLAAAAATVVLAWVIGARLLFAGAHGALIRGHLGFFAGLLLALLAASAVQVIRARTDLRRGHRLLSLTLWPLLGISLAALGAYSQWVLSVSPQELARIQGVQPAPAGDWTALYGVARGRADFSPTFLLDTSSGRFFRIQAADGRWGNVVFSGDGRRAVWLAANGRHLLFPLTAYRLDLDRPGATPVATPVSFAESFPELLALSRDGRYLASVHKDRILVEEVENGRLLLSEPVTAGEYWGRQWLFFLENGLLRFYGRQITGKFPGGMGAVHLMDIDLTARRVVRSLSIPLDEQMFVSVSQDGGLALLESKEQQLLFSEFQVLEVLTKETSSPIPLRGAHSWATFLRDGRVLASVRSGGRLHLRLLDSHAKELRRFDLAGSHLRIGGQPDPGHLVVGTAPARSDNKVKDWRCFLLDLERGTLRPIGDGLLPAGWLALPAGSLGTELFIREEGGLVRMDPLTGRTRVILD